MNGFCQDQVLKALEAHLFPDFLECPPLVFSVCSALTAYQRKVSPVLAYPSSLSKAAILLGLCRSRISVEKTVQYNVIAQIKLENNNMKKTNQCLVITLILRLRMITTALPQGVYMRSSQPIIEAERVTVERQCTMLLKNERRMSPTSINLFDG